MYLSVWEMTPSQSFLSSCPIYFLVRNNESSLSDFIDFFQYLTEFPFSFSQLEFCCQILLPDRNLSLLFHRTPLCSFCQCMQLKSTLIPQVPL